MCEKACVQFVQGTPRGLVGCYEPGSLIWPEPCASWLARICPRVTNLNGASLCNQLIQRGVIHFDCLQEDAQARSLSQLVMQDQGSASARDALQTSDLLTQLARAPDDARNGCDLTTILSSAWCRIRLFGLSVGLFFFILGQYCGFDSSEMPTYYPLACSSDYSLSIMCIFCAKQPSIHCFPLSKRLLGTRIPGL